MMVDDDDFFLDDDAPLEEETANTSEPPWVLLVVDDEPGIHDVTSLALRDFSLDGRRLEIINAYTGDEAFQLLEKRDDIAVILLDVVMENDHAGLECARRIREDLNNLDVRIVLRTGQPGVAPEREVILAYDINDYKAKTELTAQHLFTTVVAALRSFSDIQARNQYRDDAYAVLHRQNTHESQILDLMPTPVFYFDAMRIVTGCNQAFLKMTGLTADQVIGFATDEVLDEESGGIPSSFDFTTFDEGETRSILTEANNRPYELKITSLVGGGNHDVGFAALYLDRT